MSNFWANLPQPFTVLAPMENVTDFVFREIVACLLPKPNVFFTEFTSADGLNSKGREETIEKLKFSEAQRPIVAQIWGTNADNLYKAAQLVSELGFDGVDINMGCPVPAVMKHGAGAAFIKNPKLAKECIEAVKSGSHGLPVSVKTRIGYQEIITEDWISFLLEQKIDALTVHGRTAKQMSKGEANWKEIGKVVLMRNEIAPNTIIIGNGDVKDYPDAVEKHHQFHMDGAMIGRGIFTNPWTFDKTTHEHSKEEYLDILVKHMDLYDKVWGDTHHFDVLKKFFKMYVREFDGANELRQKLMECKNSTEAKKLLKDLD
jgi:nifR3 family TIM-barrel protein